MSISIFGCERTFSEVKLLSKTCPRRASTAEKQLFNLPARNITREGLEKAIEEELERHRERETQAEE